MKKPGRPAPRALVLLVVSLAALASQGCATGRGVVASLRERREVRTEVGAFEMTYAEGDESSRDALEQAIRLAAPRLVAWGKLREQVRVVVLPTHEALEAVVNRRDYDWLRAWARYDEIFVQSPRTWTITGANPADVNELMLHELTHCLMYQRSASRGDWTRRRIPLWFREGMASVTANQAYRWPALEDLARFYWDNPGKDPVGEPDSLYQSQNEVVYGAAHHAFTFLAQRYGRGAVELVMEEMSRGAAFPDAFIRAIGISAGAFVEDFRRYVKFRGFRVPRPGGDPALRR